MGAVVLFRYLTLTARSGLTKFSSSTGLLVVSLSILSLFVGSLFWLIGSLSTSSFFFAVVIIGLVLIGIWGGLGYLTAYRPNGWSWLRKSDWLWLKALPVMLVGLLVAGVTVGPYYLSGVRRIQFLEGIEIKLALVLLAMAAVFLGLAIAIGTRQVTRNPYVRLLMLAIAVFLLSKLIFSTSIVAVISQALLSHAGDRLLILMLASLGLFVSLLLTLQLTFDGTRLAHRSRPVFWEAQPATRLLGLTHQPAFGYFLSRLALYGRSTFLQRRIVVFFALTITTQMLGGVMLLSYQTLFLLQMGLLWFLASSIGTMSGKSAAEESGWLASAPVSFNPNLVSKVAMTCLMVICLSLSWALLPILSPLILLLSATMIAMVIFDSSHALRLYQLSPGVGQQFKDRGLLGGVVASLVFVALPIMLDGIAPTLTIAGLMLLWFVGIGVKNKAVKYFI